MFYMTITLINSHWIQGQKTLLFCSCHLCPATMSSVGLRTHYNCGTHLKKDSMRLSTLVQRNTENKLAMVNITIQKDAYAQCIGST